MTTLLPWNTFFHGSFSIRLLSRDDEDALQPSQWKLIQTAKSNVLGPKVLVGPSRPVDESVPELVKCAKIINPPGRFMGVSRFRRAAWDHCYAYCA